MKTTIAVLICIMLPLVPGLITAFLMKEEERAEEHFEFDYR